MSKLFKSLKSYSRDVWNYADPLVALPKSLGMFLLLIFCALLAFVQICFMPLLYFLFLARWLCRTYDLHGDGRFGAVIRWSMVIYVLCQICSCRICLKIEMLNI
jgi:hypothetical protein